METPFYSRTYLQRDQPGHEHRQVQLPRDHFAGTKRMCNRVHWDDSRVADCCQHPKTVVDPSAHRRKVEVQLMVRRSDLSQGDEDEQPKDL